MMKKLVLIALFASAMTSAAAQNISNLPPAASVNATDQYIVNQVGGTGPTGFVTRRATVNQMATFIASTLQMIVGTSAINGGVSGRVLFDNAGVLGELVLNCGALANSAPSCSIDATNASNISSGTLAAARGGAGTVNGALKGNGSGVVTQAACADLSNGATGCSTATGTIGATVPLNNGNNTFSGVDTFTGDALFRSGRPWCDVRSEGAVGDGSTNDAAAFNACITILAALGGGVLYVPPSPSAYCLFTGITLSTGVRLTGAGINVTKVSACGNDVQLITIAGRYASIERMTIFGKGTGGDTNFGATQKTVVINAGSGSSVLDNLQIAGGTIPLEVNAPDVIGTDIHIGNLQPAGYGSAMMHLTQGGWYRRISLDNVWPQSIPAAGFAASVPARTNTTGYTAGQLVTLSGFYLQCMTSGTSGGSPPALQNYGININDGTVVWQIVMPVGMAGILVDGTNGEVQIVQSDIGATENAIVLNSSNANFMSLSQALFSGPSLVSSISAQQGRSLTVDNSVISAGLLTTGTGITLGSSWGGDTRISNNVFSTVGAYGVLVNGGTNTQITGNSIFGMTTAGIGIAAGVSHFTIAGNALGTSSSLGTNATPITIAAGSGNNYWIVGNDVAGATNPISDGGTGTTKYVPDTGTTSIAGTLAPSCGTATFSVGAANAKTIGKLTYVTINTTITAIGTCTTPATLTLPNTTATRATLSGQEIVNGFLGVFCTGGAGATTVTCRKNANTAFAVNDQIVLSGQYENQ